MPRKKAESATPPTEKSNVMVWPKAPTDWSALLGKVAHDHWRTLRVTIQINDKIMAGKPMRLDVAQAMLKARGLEDQIEAVPLDDAGARVAAADDVEQESKCEFHRRPGRPGVWLPSNNIKAMLKENWGVLGLRLENRGSRGALAEGVFVFGEDPKDPEWIYLGKDASGEESGVVHSVGPAGPRSSLKTHEFVERPVVVFLVKIARAIEAKLPADDFARTLYHAQFHGMGADRSQGRGTFQILSVEEVEADALSPELEKALAAQ